MKKKSDKIWQRTGWFFLWMVILITVSYISSLWFFRIDLTQDKRYTLSGHTREVLESLDDVVHVTVYLEGDMPVTLKTFRRSVKEILDEYRIASGKYIEYEFINPLAPEDPSVRADVQNDLISRGLRPMEVMERRKDGSTGQRLLFPGVTMHYRGRNLAVNLLLSNPGFSSDQNLNHSIQGLEYAFTHALKAITAREVKKIAFVEGHGEYDGARTADITDELARYYEVYRGYLDTLNPNLDEYHVIIIAGPVSPFAEKEKFMIDQYIMNGGRVLWLLDRIEVYQDSLSAGENTLALIRDLNLDDQLFRYGVRINPDLVKDIQSALIPVNTARVGEQPRFTPAAWHFHPLLAPRSGHPVTRNLNLVKAQYASSIDTLPVEGVRITGLLLTSEYTRLVKAPVFISLRQVDEAPVRSEYNSPFTPVAVLLEGRFTSVFSNRMLADYPLAAGKTYSGRSTPTAMIVVSDADIIRNDLRWRGSRPEPLPLGFDRYMQQTFGNKDFIMNAVNYLSDDSGLMQLRVRDFRLRLLNKVKLAEELMFWKILNLILPLLLLLTAAFLFNLGKSIRYAGPK